MAGGARLATALRRIEFRVDEEAEGCSVSKRRVRGDLRVFGVARDLGEGDEIGLHEVLTWATFGDLRKYADPQTRATRTPWDLMTKTVMLGEHGATVSGGMSMTISTEGGESDFWLVKLGQDRPLRELRDGSVIALLDVAWGGGDGAAVWKVFGRPTGATLSVSGDKLVIAGVPGANT
jgi:hypothetical protein